MNRLMLYFICLTAFQNISAQVDTISIKNNNLQIQYLKEGNSQFLTWSKDSITGNISGLLLWERYISFANLSGKPVVVISQQRISGDTNRKTFVYTVSDKKNLQTIYDYRQDANSGIKAYNYIDHEITGADTVKGNTKIGFHLSFQDIPYCFEIDLETLSLLPLKFVGQQMAINFYHPGGTVPPKYYRVSVIGRERIYSIDDYSIDCWIIRLDYDAENYDVSWISVKNHEYLKLESHFPKGTYYKTKLFNSSQRI
jgi:hypothetical protein